MTLTEIPNLELDVIVLHRLDVEPDRCSKTNTDTTPPHIKSKLDPYTSNEMHTLVGHQNRKPTWDRGDDLPNLQPICKPHHMNQNSETPTNRTADPRQNHGRFGAKEIGLTYRG